MNSLSQGTVFHQQCCAQKSRRSDWRDGSEVSSSFYSFVVWSPFPVILTLALRLSHCVVQDCHKPVLLLPPFTS